MIKEGMKEGWEYKRFDDIMTPAKVERCGNREGIKVLSITMRSGIIEQNERFSKSIASKDRSNYKIVKNGQLVIAFPIDEGLIFTQDIADEGIMSPAYNIWDVNYSLVNRKFLVAYFHSPFAFSYYRAKLRGSTQRRRSMDKGDLLSMPIPVPSLNIQEKIVSELDLLSGVIEKQKAQLEELDKLAQSIFYDMFGDPVTNEKGWKSSTIGETCSLKSGNSEANYSKPGIIPYVKVGDMNMKGNETFIHVSSTYIDKESNIKDLFPIGTTIFPKRGGAILTNKKRLTKVEICCDLNVMGVIPNINVVHPMYVFFYFLNIDFKIFGDTGSSIPQINNHNINPMKIGLPPLSLQQEFAAKVEAIESMKAKVRQSLKEAETLLNSRMDYYFN